VTISFVMSVRLYHRPSIWNNLVMDSHEIWYEYIWKICWENSSFIKTW